MASAPSNLLVFTPSASSAFRSVLRGISHFAQCHGWSVRVVDTERSSSSPSEMIREWSPMACITYYLDPTEIPESIPTVHVNPTIRTANRWMVCHDSSSTGELAAREMVAIGLERFGFVGSPMADAWSRQRGETYMRTLASLGFACDSPNPSGRQTNPVADQRAIGKWLKALNPPCGIFAANDRIADLVVAAAKAVHLEIPSDIAVIGADNDEQTCENSPVSLTSVAPDFICGGELACELLEARLSGRSRRPETIAYGDLGIVRRASTRRQRRPSVMVAEMLEFIRKNAISGISPADVSVRCQCARRTAELAFKAATGHSIGQELADVRIDLAIKNLADPMLRIGEIPSLVGYVSQNQLERVFRRKFGFSMREWRKARIT